ncbi:MAG: hypothetical protein JWN70_5075 [Planctomycetaceae bacterium]|nr:hypothetical protein [Planctomycetaceae bacterium]
MPSGLRASRHLKSGLLACCVGLIVGSCSLEAAEPRRELWQLVPKDVGLAVEARGLSEQTRQFLTSEVFQRIQRHSAWQHLLQSKEIKDLQELQQTVRDVTKQPLLGWLEKLLGQEVLLSITPQTEGRPRSVLLLRLKQPADLPVILEAWGQLEPRTETRFEHHGQVYFSRSKASESGDPLFYSLIDDVLIVSDRAESLMPVLDLAKDAEHRGAVSGESNFQQTMKALNPAAAIRIFIQPAAWDPTRESRPSEAKDVVERLIKGAWARCQAIGIGVRQESGLVAEIIARSDDLAQNSFWMKLVSKTSGAPAFLARVPKTAILAFAGRHDLADMTEWAFSQIPADGLKKMKSTRQVINGFLLGNDLLTDILPQLPGDFGGYLVPREDLQLAAVPVDGLLAVALPVQAEGDTTNNERAAKPNVRSSVDNALRTTVSLLTAMHNATSPDEAAIEHIDQQGVTVHWIDSLGPIQPAYALSPEYFLVASSPKLIRDFLSQSPSNTWGADDRLKKLRAACFADASQIVALHGRLLGDVIRERREFLLKQLQAFHKLKPDEAGKRLDRMLEWVQLSDAVVIASSLHADHLKVVLVIAVQEAQPKQD